MRKLVYLIATSADGYIADPEGRIDVFPQPPDLLAAIFAEYPETCPTHLREALAVTGPPRRFDTVMMGANTHRPALDAGLSSAYPHLGQFVVTHRRDLPADPTVTVVDSDPVASVRDLKAQPGRDIWLAGGADLARQLWSEIDELHLKVNPIVLGGGIPLVPGPVEPRPLQLLSATVLAGRVVLQRYSCGTTPPLRNR